MAERDPAYTRFLPYEEPYDDQREAMERIGAALSAGRNVLFEGACGTGKTLAALAPALEHARGTDRTVLIATNVHQQTRQFIAEARAITRAEPIRAVVFRGKDSMCHIDVGYEECQVLRDNTHDLVDAERDTDQLERRASALLERMQEGDDGAAEARSAVMEELDALEADLDELREANTCERYYRNLTADTGEFEAWLFEDVRTPDEVYEHAHEAGFCGYELLKDALDGVDLVVCNYHHLLDPAIRTQFFRWLDRDPEDVIAVLDEAHNVEDAAREHASRSLTETTLEGALDELRSLEDERADPAANVLSAFRDALRATYRGVDPGPEWTDVPVDNEDRRDDLTLSFLEAYAGRGIEADLEAARSLGEDIEERYERAYREGETDTRRECRVRPAAEFVTAYFGEATDGAQYPVVAARRDETSGEPYGRAELYTCIPRAVTRPLFESVHAAVLMSATLRPFEVTADVLGLPDPETMAFGLSFPEEHRRTFAVDVPPLFAADRDDPALQRTVAGALEDTMAFTPGNTLAFFPSYAEAERYAGLVDREVHLDEPGRRVQDLKESFAAESDAALFTSLWGTLTEGVSFDGDAARTVAVVGVPYPHLDDRLEAVQAAYDDAFAGPDAGWEYAVEAPTVRKTRQALGRALRAPEEVGARVLLDRRYTGADMGEYSVRDAFPPEEREELIDVAPGKLKFALLNFYAGHDAWGGDPPAP